MKKKIKTDCGRTESFMPMVRNATILSTTLSESPSQRMYKLTLQVV